MSKAELSRPGIYAIRNRVNGKSYVGSSSNIYSRWTSHRSLLSRGVHDSAILQRAWDKYGAKAFDWEVLEYCDVESLIVREEHWIEALNSRSHAAGYNIRAKADSNRGHKFPPEFGAKISASKRGKPQTPASNARRAASLKGRKPSPQAIQARRLRGNCLTPEAIRKIAFGRAKVDPGKILEIQRLLDEGRMTQMEIAAATGVNQPYVSKVKNRKFARLTEGADLPSHAAEAAPGPAEDPGGGDPI